MTNPPTLKLRRAKKVVVFGGGSAVPSAVLPGLKNAGLSITTVTSMTDSGGSTGALRKEFNVRAMGDIRRHILALSEAEQWKKDLWKFRFANDLKFDDGHKGHNFANVFIGGLEKITNDYEKTLEITHEFMKVKGSCFPATMEKIHLFAELETRVLVKGEDDIDVPKPGRDTTVKISKIWLEPEAEAYGKVVEALLEADYVIIGPGDLYSSLLPCFLPRGMKEAIVKSKAKIIYVCNVLAKPGESYKFTANDHAAVVLNYIGREKIDFFIVNREETGKKLVKEREEFKDYHPVAVDAEALQKNAAEIVYADTVNPDELAKALKNVIE